MSLVASAAAAEISAQLEAAAGGNAAHWAECAAELAAIDAAPAAQANARYLPALQQLLAWRVLTANDKPCVQLDWPFSRALTPRQTQGLFEILAAQDAASHVAGQIPLPLGDTEPREQHANQLRWLPAAAVLPGADQPSLPLCPRTPPSAELTALELPETVAPLVLRVRPHRCRAGSRPMAGSGVLLSPELALTAAHVVLTADGLVCDRYRVTPGGRRYSNPPAAPYGNAYVSRAYLSERGGWHAAAVAPALNDNYRQRIAHDYAFLVLNQPARLPAHTLWPQLRFNAPALLPGQRVLRAGYPLIGPTGRVAPGAAVNLYGQVACAQSEDPFMRFALWMAPGASGGPIWRWPDSGQPLELLSLGVRLETWGDHQYETLGPRFDRSDYRRLVQLLAQRADRVR